MSPWMTVKECADYLRRHPQTVLHLLHTEQLVGYQTTAKGSWRIHRDDADIYLRTPAPRRRLRTA